MAAVTGIQGVDALRASLDTAAHELAGLSSQEAGQLLLRDAEARAPRDTEVLAASHDLVVSGSDLHVIATARYAAIVHAREPWMEETFIADQDAVLDLYADAVADIVENIKGA